VERIVKTVLKFDAGGRAFRRVAYLLVGFAAAFLAFGIYYIAGFLQWTP
jgi:hypothetical protein